MSKCLWFLVIGLLGCSRSSEAAPVGPMASAATVVPMSAPVEPGGAPVAGGPLASVRAMAALPAERAVIRNAALQLSHESPERVTEQATTLIRGAGGYALDSTTQTAEGAVLSSTVVLRVPEPAFDEVLRSLRKLGTLREENTTGQDLTEEFVDTEARLRALRKLEARLVSLLEHSARLSDLLQVEQEVARVDSEIDRIEGRLRYLRERTQMSTITLSVYARHQPHVSKQQSVASRLHNAFRTGGELSVGVLESVIVTLGFILPTGVAFALFATPIVWMIKRRRRALVS